MQRITPTLPLLLLAAYARADHPESSASSTATSTAPGATHTIKVGWPVGQHAFDPDYVQARVGDFILFEMYPQNHSVAQMDETAPCVPLSSSKPSVLESESYWSGFYPVKDVRHLERAKTFKVNNEEPAYFYCSAPDSCIKYGMIMAVNPTNNRSDLLDAKSRAKSADFAISPGEPIPAEGDSKSSPSPTSSKAASEDDEDDSGGSHSSSSSHLSTGAIAGIVIGSIGAFALVGLLFFFVGRRKKAQEVKPSAPQGGEQTVEHPPMYQDPRYSALPSSPAPWMNDGATVKQGHASVLSEPGTFQERNPHRLSELASQNYDPVEIYTPGLPEHRELESPPPPGSPGLKHDARRDTVG